METKKAAGKIGRPKGPAKHKVRKGYVVPGGYTARQEKLARKHAKLDMLEFLIGWWEKQPAPDHVYIHTCKKRANELRDQISHFSLHD